MLLTVFLEKKTFCLQLSGQVTQHVCIDKVILSRKPVQEPSYSVQAGSHLSRPYAISDPIENLPTNFRETSRTHWKSHSYFTFREMCYLVRCPRWIHPSIHLFIHSNVTPSILLSTHLFTISQYLFVIYPTINSMRKGICLYCSLFWAFNTVLNIKGINERKVTTYIVLLTIFHLILQRQVRTARGSEIKCSHSEIYWNMLCPLSIHTQCH